MKKLFLIIFSSFLFMGCNNQKENYKSDKGWTFEKISQEKNKKYNFDKVDNNSKVTLNKSKSDVHEGCTAACCSGK
tara:strand:- start:568 stop:795 length:228 start_codon:yes stop_codon:yes gene_type:complete